jgi:RHH-type proline utilization regulon transcriptional repressor/proline dehydrogenase/delta 1-pyrroline-5-carboxylate dehydrogenase
MDVEEIAEPPVGPIRCDSELLRLARQWRLELAWGGHRPHHHDLHKTVVAIQSYLHQYEETFARETDFFHLRGQDNLLRYLPVGRVVIRLHENDGLFEVLGRIAAARVAGCVPVVSLPEGLHNDVTDFLRGPDGKRIVGEAALVRQTDAQLVRFMPQVQRIRYAAPDRVPAAVLEAAAGTGFYVARTPVRMDGRLELLHYFREQSICDNYHRYGNLGERGTVPGTSCEWAK